VSVGVTWRDEDSGWLVRAGADTQLGNYREINQDHVLLDAEVPLALALDGMGGTPGGERGAQIGAEAIRARVRSGHADDEPSEAFLEAALRAGHDAILRWQTTDTNYRNCGSTVAAAWVEEGRAVVTWLGDTRAYRLTGGRLQPLTRDHNLPYALVRAGTISESEAADMRGGHVLWGCLGRSEPDIKLEFPSFVPLPGDRLILATDGVACLLEDDVFLAVCRTVPDSATCAEVLIEHALMRGSRDNCSCAVIAFERPGAGAPLEPLPSAPPRKWWQFWK
jgi:PPM family protein phosphatase